jgi:universal stress protein E
MASFSRVLCVIDPTEKEQPALARAAWLAKRTGAALDLLICYYNEYLGGEWFSDSTSLQKARADVLEGLRERLEILANPLRADGLVVATTAVWYHPLYQGIARQALALKSDVVFKDTHHHSALSRSFFTNSDWNLIRACPVPLWLVKPGEFSDEPQLIAAVDPLNEHDKPAALDDEILILSKSLATDVNGDVHAFHSYDPRIALSTATASAYAPVSFPLPEIEEELCKQHQRKFTEVVDFHQIPEDHTHLVSGLVHEELPELANNLDAAVVVMGAVSRNTMKRVFIGATAERTLEHLPCDLIVVKPSWLHSAIEAQISDAA